MIEDKSKIQVHNSFAKLEVGGDVAKSYDKLDKMPQAGQNQEKNKILGGNGDSKKPQKLIYSSAVEIINNNPNS